MRLALIAFLLLAACGDDGVPLHPDGQPASALDELDDDTVVSTSVGWEGRK